MASKRWMSLASVLMGTSMMLTACGGDTATSTPVPAAAPTNTTAAAAKPTDTAAAAAKPTDTAAAAPATATTGGSAPVAVPAGSFSWRAFSDPASMDPGLIEETLSVDISQNLYDGLTRLDPVSLKVVPDLAEKWDVTPDATVYTFHLRQDAKFSNGDPITSDDFVYSYNRAVNLPDAPYTDIVMNDIKGYDEVRASATTTDTTKPKVTKVTGIEAPDKYTLKITLKGPSAYFISQTALWTYYVVNQKVVEPNKDKEWWTMPGAGAGPYMLTEWKHNESMTLKQNPNYWDSTRKPSVDVFIPIIKETATAQQLFEAGQLAVLDQPDPNDLARLQKDAKFSKQLFNVGNARSVWIGLNVMKGPFGPLTDEKATKLRQAISMAIDRPRLIDLALSGAGKPLTTLLPEGEPGYHPFDAYPYNPDQAKKLLADAGFPNGQGLDLTYSYRQRDVEKRVAEEIQSQLKDNLGLNIKIEGIDWKVMLKARQNHEYTMFYGSWGHDFPDPQNWFYPLFHSSQIKGVGPGTGNDPGYKNDKYDKLVEEGNKLADPSKTEERFKKYFDAEEILLKDAPLVPLYQPLRYWEVDPGKWSGYGTNSGGVYPFYMVKAVK